MFLRLRGYLELVVLRRNTVRCASGMSGYQELRNAVRCAVSESGESLWPVLMPLISPECRAIAGAVPLGRVWNAGVFAAIVVVAGRCDCNSIVLFFWQINPLNEKELWFAFFTLIYLFSNDFAFASVRFDG